MMLLLKLFTSRDKVKWILAPHPSDSADIDLILTSQCAEMCYVDIFMCTKSAGCLRVWLSVIRFF